MKQNPSKTRSVRRPAFELRQSVTRSALKLRASPQQLAKAANPHVNRILSQHIALGRRPPKPELVKVAETYHALYRKHKEARMAQLARAYAQMGEPADIIASCCCSKFFPLFENWLASCAAAGIEVRDRLLLFTLDEAAQLKAETLGVQAYCLTPGRYGEAGGSVQFADRKFSRTMFYKNVIVYELLALGANVLFQDVDVVWLRDPLQHLPALEPDCDLLIMYDGPNRVHAPLYVNTGFFYARNTAASKALFETAARNTATVFNCGSHQRPFNQILAHFLIHNVLSLRILPEETFPNGHLFNIERGLRPAVQNWRDESYVAHYSWTLDIEEKCRKIEAFGFNYLPGTELVDALLSD